MGFLYYLMLTVAGLQDVVYFENPDNTFRILQPGPFIEKWERIETDIGIQEVFTYYCQPADSLYDPNFLYLINYMDYSDSIQIDSLAELQPIIFEESIQSSIASNQGRLVYSEEIERDGYPGRLSRIEYADGQMVIKSLMCLVKRRFYYIQVYAIRENSLNTKMNDFLESFKIHR